MSGLLAWTFLAKPRPAKTSLGISREGTANDGIATRTGVTFDVG